MLRSLRELPCGGRLRNSLPAREKVDTTFDPRPGVPMVSFYRGLLSTVSAGDTVLFLRRDWDDEKRTSNDKPYALAAIDNLMKGAAGTKAVLEAITRTGKASFLAVLNRGLSRRHSSLPQTTPETGS